ncbi:MAG: helix-turn-helix domain-containing protein [Acidobacteriota bacterium]
MPESELKGSAKLGTYLKQLRVGYGYSLRRVEEKARMVGGEIDNSQLSRYEKGRCYPSFDKLRVLASIFNVSIQSFSDIVDVEEYESLRPDTDAYDELIAAGNRQMEMGSYAEAYAAFQKAIDVAESPDAEESGEDTRATRLARGHYGLARALLKLGKLALAENELRNVLRVGGGVDRQTIIKTLLQLSNAHADLGDSFLARLEAEKCLAIAREESDRRSLAYAMHQLGRIAGEEGDAKGALAYFRDALVAYEEQSDTFGVLTMKINIGACHISLSHFKVGTKLIQEALRVARQEGMRRTSAFAVSKLLEAEYAQGNMSKAKAYIREVGALAGAETEEDRYTDFLFNAAYYLWRIARRERNAIQEKIAFGRLKYLRSALERVSPEVEEFDAFIGQRKSHENVGA